METISMYHDGKYQGTWSAAEVRANNADQPEILEALDKLEAGVCRLVRFNGGAGGVTELRLRRELEPPRRRALASYRGTPAEVRAAIDADAWRSVEKDAYRKRESELREAIALSAPSRPPEPMGVVVVDGAPAVLVSDAELVDAVEGRR